MMHSTFNFNNICCKFKVYGILTYLYKLYNCSEQSQKHSKMKHYKIWKTIRPSNVTKSFSYSFTQWSTLQETEKFI